MIGSGKPGPITHALMSEFRARAAKEGAEIYDPAERAKREAAK